MAQEIKFGTDGWRGIIADDFTFDNVRPVSGAIASYVSKYEEARRGVFIGYDTRLPLEHLPWSGRRSYRRRGYSGEAGQRLHSHASRVFCGERQSAAAE